MDWTDWLKIYAAVGVGTWIGFSAFMLWRIDYERASDKALIVLIGFLLGVFWLPAVVLFGAVNLWGLRGIADDVYDAD